MTKIDTNGTTNPDGDPGLDADDELVISTGLLARCDIEVLPVALRVAKNPRKDHHLRQRALRIILKNKSVNRDFLRNESVVSNLKDIALESLNDEDDVLHLFDLKRYALQCLKLKANDLSDDFYRAYCFDLMKEMLRRSNSDDISGLKKLNEHIAACQRSEKFRILESLSVALSESNCGLRISMFNDFFPSVWTKESLVYALLSNNRSWSVIEAPRFVENINALDSTIRGSDTPHSIEEVLMILIDTQNQCRLNIAFINHILTAVGRDIECLDVITGDFCFLPTSIDELAILRMKKLCDCHKIVHTREKDLTELQSLLLYSDKAIASIFDKIKSGTHITELVKFLLLLKQSDLSTTCKELFLLDLGPNDKSIDDWKKKLHLQLIENVIRREFPNYKVYSHDFAVEPSEERNIDLKYFAPISCTNAKKHTMYLQCSTISNLRKSLNSDEMKGSINKLLRNLQEKISIIALNSDWSKEFKCLQETLIKCLDSEDKIVQLTNALDILIDYEINIVDQEVFEIFSKSNALNLQRNIHKLVIERSFPETSMKKSLDNLIEELGELNGNEEIGSAKIIELSMSKYADVMRAYSGKSTLLPKSDVISKWNKKDVEKWVKKLSGHPGRSRANKKGPFSSLIDAFLSDKLDDSHKEHQGGLDSKRSRVYEEDPLSTLTDGYLFGDLGKSVKKSRRHGESEESGSEVSQAEGIAVIKKTAELISRFEVRDIQLLSVILMLNPSDAKGRLSQINTGEGKTMIISMIAAYHAIKGSKVDVITSSPLLAEPQAKHQEPFYSALGLTVSHNINNHNEGYEADIVYGTSQAFQGDILRDEFRKYSMRGGRLCDIAIVDEVDNMLVDGNNYIVMLSCEMPAMDHLAGLLATIFIQVKHAAQSIQYHDGKAYVVEKGSSYNEDGEARPDVVDDSWYPLDVSPLDFITDCAEKHIRKLIRDTPVEDQSFPEVKIPKHLRELVCKAQLKKWIGRAIAAAVAYVKDVDYILDKAEIQIVDVANTGVVKKNSQWSSGLHQFLQIKHGAKISPESLSTNFISNVNFFKRYPPKLFGLTGTLGTNGTKELLSKTYGVDSVIVPPFKLKRYKELAPIVVNNKDDWYTAIAKSCLRKLNNGRPVLTIMENIKETLHLEKVFKDHFRYDVSKIKLYKTENDVAVVEEEIKGGHVIITTNIAGRGTDIKPSKDTDANGGLHVCITFLPKNSRVEIQNIGRTSRTGNRGTSQFILWSTKENDIEELKSVRAVQEKEAMDRAEEEISRVTTKDMIFKRFCELYDTIGEGKDFTAKIEKKAVEERFAIWLEINEEYIDKDPREKVLESFESFVSEIKGDENGALIKNPYMYVLIGNNYLKLKNYRDAIKAYTSAIELDENYAEHARYNRGYAYVAEYGKNVKCNADHIDRAANDFKEARRLIDERQNDLNLIQTASDGEVFSEQVRHKLNLYNVQKNAIDIAIGPDVQALNRQIKHLREQRKSEKLKSEDINKINEAIDNMKKDKKIFGVIQKARKNGTDIEIELKEFTESLPEDDQKTHEGEIEEFERNGCIGEFRISEIPPIDWSAVIGLLLLGFAQLVGGAALIVFSLGTGSSFGMGLITEGISDIITAVKDGIINRSFDWATWAIEKAISITVSVICAGFKAIKDCAKTACSGLKAASSAVTRGLTNTGWKIVAKRIGLELAKGIGKEIAKDLIDYGVDKTIIPAIEENIVERITAPIQEALMNNPMVKKMLELDEKVNKDHYYENRIIAIGHKILNPKNNRTFADIALEVASRVANNKIKRLAVCRQIAEALEALVKLDGFVSNFIDELNEAINEEARKKKIDEKSVEMIVQEKERGELEVEAASKKDDDEELDFSRSHVKDEQIKLEEREPRSSKAISKEFVKAASANMLNIIKGKIISPVVQSGVNYGMDKITSSIHKSIEHETQLFKSHNRIIHNQDIGYKDVKQKKRHVSRPGYEAVTEAQLIKAADEIERVRAGGPAGLVHLGALSDAADCPIDVCNEDGKVMYRIGDEKKGTPVKVEYHEPKNGETTGHYTLPGNKEPSIFRGGSNMCLYNVVAEQTGLDPNALKNQSLNIMSENVEAFAKQSSDIAHLEMYCKMKLAHGGAVCNAKNPNEMEAYLINSDGVRGFRKASKPPKGHPLHHVPYKRTLRDHLEATSEELQTNIEVYDDKKNLLYTVGNYKMKGDKKPLQFKYDAPDGDKSGEHLMSIGGKEEYRFHDPNTPSTREGMNYWRILGKMTGKDPDTLKTNITKKMDAKVIPADESYQRTLHTHFEATSVILKANVEVYDEKGTRLYTVGNNKKEGGKEPVKLEYRPPKGGKSGEYVSLSTDDKERHRFVDPPHANIPPEQMNDYWKTLGKITKQDPDSLKSSVTERMDAKMPRVSCVEEASLASSFKTGYLSMSYACLVNYHAMQHPEVKAAMAKLNEYEKGVKDSNEYISQQITLSAADLNLPHTAYGAEWRDGEILHVWPINGPVEIKIQHYKGKENDRNADVHIQTSFPRPPPEDEYLW